MAKKAFEQVWKSITGTPGVNLAGKRYYLGKFDANGDLVPCGAGEHSVGVIYEPNNIGQPTQVVAHGYAFVVLGGTVAAGTEVQSDANGAAVAYSTGRSAGYCAVGGVAGDIGTILLR